MVSMLATRHMSAEHQNYDLYNQGIKFLIFKFHFKFYFKMKLAKYVLC